MQKKNWAKMLFTVTRFSSREVEESINRFADLGSNFFAVGPVGYICQKCMFFSLIRQLFVGLDEVFRSGIEFYDFKCFVPSNAINTS